MPTIFTFLLFFWFSFLSTFLLTHTHTIFLMFRMLWFRKTKNYENSIDFGSLFRTHCTHLERVQRCVRLCMYHIISHVFACVSAKRKKSIFNVTKPIYSILFLFFVYYFHFCMKQTANSNSSNGNFVLNVYDITLMVVAFSLHGAIHLKWTPINRN